MRTQDEIRAKFDELCKQGSEDFFGFMREDLIVALEFEHAKEHLKKELTKEEWDAYGERLRTDTDVIAKMRDYMDFAWEKANDKRGLSAGRTMQHYQVWLWLIGQDELSDSLRSYTAYGKPHLVRICQFLDLDPKKWDDGDRRDSE